MAEQKLHSAALYLRRLVHAITVECVAVAIHGMLVVRLYGMVDLLLLLKYFQTSCCILLQ